MPEDRTPRKISLTEPTDADEDLRPRSRRMHEAKELNRSLPRHRNGGASSPESADIPAEYGDSAQRRLV